MGYQANKDRYEKMVYRYCGKSGLKLPVMSFGLWHNFGDESTYENCSKMITGAFDVGITHFDLANNYGPKPGAAETRFGEILKRELKGHRDELVISTKAGYVMWDGPYGDGGSKKYLISSLDQSLKRMELDYVDIFYHHRPDTQTPMEETADALTQIVKQGKALYIGISNYSPEQTEQMNQLLLDRGVKCIIHQLRYSMLDRENEKTFGVIDKNGIGSIAFCPLAQGLLTDKYISGIPNDSRAAGNSIFLKKDNILKEKIDKVVKLNDLANRRNQTLAQMALVWTLKKSTFVILGASRLEQIQENVRALENMHFTEEELNIIKNIL